MAGSPPMSPHQPAERWRLPETVLPDGDQRQLWVDGGLLTARPVDGSEPLPGRFALPGLVDAHAHTSMQPVELRGTLEAVRISLRRNLEEGVLLVRDVGAPGSVTLELPPDPSLPRMQAAGRWHARRDRFFAELHEPVEPDELLASALAEVTRGARWVKVLADFRTPELTYDPAVLRQVIDAVHAAGARVAVHTQWEGSREVVEAGADSIEHGCRLDEGSLERMAASGAAWTPTLTVFAEPPSPDATPEQRARWDHDLASYRAMVPRAAALGVTILAGTDLGGSVAEEVRHLIDFGLTPVEALRSATTDARAFLREPALDAGAPADVVTFDEDPREDPSALGRPVAIVLGGVRVH